jgi:two-component system, LytTR family, sensor kinase
MKKVIFTLIFWIIYLLTFAIFSSGYAGFVKSFYFSLIVVFFQASLTYINLWLWIPLFLKRKRFAWYILCILITIIVLSILRFQIPSLLAGEGRRIIPMRPRIVFFVFNLILAYSISTAYYFVVEWFRNVQLKADLKYQQVESELKYLKSQINPHFLFNTLNNIYTLCYLKDDKAAPAVMKLSEMMRYMLHDSNTSLIELEREIQFIRSYLELQQLKKDTPMRISFETSGVKGMHKIAPLLLISFFENCFKHGDIETNSDGWINANLHVDNTGEMKLTISNSKRHKEAMNEMRSHVGLENVKKRMSMLYDGRHQLDICDDRNQYHVHLTLKLDV